MMRGARCGLCYAERHGAETELASLRSTLLRCGTVEDRGVNIVHRAIERINTTDTDKQMSILRRFQDAAQIARHLNTAHRAFQ